MRKILLKIKSKKFPENFYLNFLERKETSKRNCNCNKIKIWSRNLWKIKQFSHYCIFWCIFLNLYCLFFLTKIYCFVNCLIYLFNLDQPWATCGPHAALSALLCGPSKAFEIAYFIEKSTKYVEKVSILALDMTF
jgi:hypothetical protein